MRGERTAAVAWGRRTEERGRKAMLFKLGGDTTHGGGGGALEKGSGCPKIRRKAQSVKESKLRGRRK